MGGSFRFNRTAEHAKIELSGKAEATADFSWLEADLSLAASRLDLEWQRSRCLIGLVNLPAMFGRRGCCA